MSSLTLWGVVLGATLLAPIPAMAARTIHAAIGSDGRLLISDEARPGLRAFRPQSSRPDTLPVRTPAPTQARQPPVALHALITRAAAEAGVDARLVRAVAWHESRYNPRAVSPAGAAGVMQLMPDTARRFGVSDRFDAQQSLRGGARYLAWLLQRYEQDVVLALAAYNAGEGNVQKHGNRVPPFRETQHYVRKVMHTYAQRD